MSVLIVDDDEMWLALHERRLRNAGIECRSTQWGKEAIEIALTDTSIKFALVDEILFVPPIPQNEEKRVLQQFQGTGVVRRINDRRPDIKIVMVTSAPQLRSGGDNIIFRKETAALRRTAGVIDLVHKDDIEKDPEGEYKWLIEGLLRPATQAVTDIDVKPRVLIGLGFDRETYAPMAESIAESLGKKPQMKWLRISPLLRIGEGAIDKLFERADEKKVFVEMPASKRLDPSGIKADSSAFSILFFLAKQAETGKEVLIREGDYQYAPRNSVRTHRAYTNRPAHAAQAPAGETKTIFEDELTSSIPDLDKYVNQDFVSEYDADGRRRLRDGVQIEGSPEKKNSPLKTAISRLKRTLASLNVGRAHKLFNFEGGGYRPGFRVGIIIYTTDLTKGRSR